MNSYDKPQKDQNAHNAEMIERVIDYFRERQPAMVVLVVDDRVEPERRQAIVDAIQSLHREFGHGDLEVKLETLRGGDLEIKVEAQRATGEGAP